MRKNKICYGLYFWRKKIIYVKNVTVLDELTVIMTDFITIDGVTHFYVIPIVFVIK